MKKPVSFIWADLQKVPPFPAVASKLLTLLSNQDVAFTAVAELINSDAALTAHLLQYANSAVYGRGSPVTDVGQAVGLLGLDQMRQLTVLYSTAGYATRAPSNVELQSCWRHSIATAVLAAEIAEVCGAFTKIGFTAGILHDIGRLGLMVAFPRQYTRVILAARGRYLDLLDLEREKFGMDHTEAGRLLAETWKLPTEFRVIAGRHHDPCEGVELDLLRIIHVACQLADVLGFYVVPPPAESNVRAILDTLPDGAGKHLHGTADELRTRVEQHIHKVI